MWLVNQALRQPYLVYVGILLTCVFGGLSYFRTPTDILPALEVPVVVVFAGYRGMPAPDMEQTVTSILERALTKCDHLDHIESRSLLGISIIQVYFRPNVSGDIASSQVISLVNGEMQNLPPGMLPPNILNYDASAIPVGNLVISSDTRDDRFLLDIADTRLREDLAGIQGLSAAPVFGGVFRQVQIYVQPRSLEALGMSPLDVARIVNTQSTVIPTGEIRIDKQNYYVRSNALIQDPQAFGDIPLYNDGRKVVKLKDVADIVDGTRWRTNIVRVDGRRAVYMPLLRQAGASAVTVVDNVRKALGDMRERGTVPDDVTLEVAFDQSIYVRDALANLRHEAILGAVLASLVVLLFLGSLRTTWIVAASIPLSLLAAFAGLYFTGKTLNIMTLGGLALVLGRVVDDSVVDVENTVRHLQMGKSPFRAALDSAREISVPVLMATVTTVVVFLPLVFMTGMGKYLFTPLAVSVALALFASYLVSRTVSPLLCARFLKTPPPGQTAHAGERFPPRLLAFALFFASLGLASYLALEFVPPALGGMPSGTRRAVLIGGEVLMFAGIAGAVLLLAAPLFWFAPTFDRMFGRFTAWYERLLLVALRRRTIVFAVAGSLLVPAYFAFRATGQELFPDVDSSEFTLHMRASGGPRVEETENQIADIEAMIRGYQATPAQVHLDVAQSLAVGDDAQVEAIRAANPERAEWLDRLVEVMRAKGDVGPIIPQGDGRTFTVPGLIPEEDLELMLANIGISSRWSAIYTPNNGPHAAFLRVQLRSGFAGRRVPTQRYVDRLRVRLQKRYPMHDFFIESGGMIRRILNNGALSPIEVQVTGRDHTKRREATRLLQRQIAQLASVQDAQAPQGIDLPQLTIVVDRLKAAQPGLTESDIIRNVITALMSSSQIAPNFWIDPATGNPYVIGVQYPEYVVKGIRTLEEIPVTGGKVGRDAYNRTPAGNDGTERTPTTIGSRGGNSTRVVRLEDVASIERGLGPVEVYHYGGARVSQVFVSVAESDLGGVASDVEGVVRRFPVIWATAHLPATRKELREDPAFLDEMARYLAKPTDAKRQEIRDDFQVDPDALRMPKDIRVTVRGEVQSMRHSFREMRDSLFLAVLLIYLVMAAQFGSWLDPLIMIVSAPLGLIGVAFMLWGTGTTLNIQSAMGVLMMVGISVSNSVLVVEFANRQRELGMRARDAILSASCVRLRPILMTTIATLVGLLPMAIHRHPGDEMNLPLARAVIGGLAGSTVLTLFVVPCLYSLLERSPRAHHVIAGAEGPPPSDPAATFDFPGTKTDGGESASCWPADMRPSVEPEPQKPDDPPQGRPQP